MAKTTKYALAIAGIAKSRWGPEFKCLRRLIDKILQTVTRMATTETNHPIQAWIKRAIKHGGPPHMSNLGNLVKHYPEYIQPDKMEHISAYIRPPWWMPTITTAISTANKDEAAKAHQKRLHQIPTQDLIIYTDGSGHNGHIGAAVYSPKTNDTRGEYIGTGDTHNVYAAELTAIQMAVELFKEKIDKHTKTYIFTDNQSAIQAIESPKRQSGQYIVKEILNTIDRIQEAKPRCTIHIEWVWF